MTGTPTARRRTRLRRTAPELAPLDGGPLPLEQQVYVRLRQALMAGRIPAGAALSVRSIGETLGVSRAPVRDALKRLEAEGVLQARPRSAFYTPPVSVAEYDAILAVRLRLEGLAAAQAAEHAGPAQLQVMEAACARYEAALVGPAAALSALNYDFHFAIYRAAPNPVLVDLIATLWVRLGPLLARVRLSPGEDSVSHHRAAIEAIRSRDAAAAEAAIVADLSGAARTIRATIIDCFPAAGG